MHAELARSPNLELLMEQILYDMAVMDSTRQDLVSRSIWHDSYD